MNNFLGRVYLITNTSNNKRYVGQTTQSSIKTRWSQHLYLARVNAGRSAITAAIRKYGPEMFTIEVLEDRAKDQVELNLLEEAYIEVLTTLAPSGYNLKSHSDGRGSLHQSTRDKMSNAKIGVKFSPTHLANLRAASKRRIHTVSPEAREKISAAHKGKPNKALYKETIVYNKDTKKLVYFNSIGQAANYMNCSPSNVTAALKDIIKTIKGKYTVYLLQDLANSVI